VIVIEKKQSLFMRLMGMDPSTLYKSYIQELDAYRELKGVNILKMIGHSYEQTDSEIKLMILTEFMENGSLASLLKTQNFKSISLRRRFDIACDISSGMARIHEHGFIHRDIRPDNILISGNYRAKIGDMGIAKFFDLNNNIHTQIGCRAYMPAEFYTGIYDQKLDVYTFGLTLIELFDGLHSKKHPISIEKEAIFMNEYIEKCIQDDPVNRPTSKLLRNSLTLIQKITDKIVFTKLDGYIMLPTEIKNKAFKRVYNLVIGEIKREIKREREIDE
jgi:serine/threonine protein kinase